MPRPRAPIPYHDRVRTSELQDHRSARICALVLFALALTLRLWGLGSIPELVFDETYYVKDAYTITQQGVEMAWPDKPDPAFEAGDIDIYEDRGSYVAHPPVGKWVIGAGEALLGANSPWGWRISVALLGSAMVPMLMLIARRLFRSTLVGAIAGLLLAVDGLHIVHSRTSLLDLVLAFFVLSAFGALLIDRDRTRAALVEQAARLQEGGGAWPTRGLRAGLRPWRLTAGVMLGLACGVKWSGLYVLAVFGIMTVLWDWWTRRSIGEPHPLRTWFRFDAVPAFFSTVGTAAVVYVASWSGWFFSAKGYDRQWAQENGAATGFAPWDALRSLWAYHQQVYEFHVGLETEHPYMASPLGWPLMIRPTNFYYRGYTYGEHGCTVADCSSQVLAIGNPLIWWLGCLAVLVTLVIAIRWRDGRAWAPLAGIIGGYLPWMMYLNRTVFTFYAVVFEPFMILCLAFVLGLIIGPRRADSERRLAGGLFVASLLALIVLVSAFFWPIWTGEVIDLEQWRWRMWLPSWT